MPLQITNETRQQVLAEQVCKASSLLARLRGLLFSPPLELDQGMLIIPCNAIHCIGMTYSIDAIFIDKKLVVVGLCEDLKPWQISAIYPRAHSCLELPAGVISKTGTQIGDQLIVMHAASGCAT